MKIGIDLGGSHIGIGLVQEDKIIDIKEKQFNRQDRVNIEETITNSIMKMLTELLQENNLLIEDVDLIGIASPGTISNGKIVKAGNLNIKDFDLVSKLKEKYTIPIKMRNDGKCAALAEKYYGAMKEFEDCVFINIGTGIGGAVFMDGKLLEPKRYSGFEIGHMIVNKGGRKCSCGKQGCLEAYASIKALKNKVTETLDMDNDISGQYLREELLIKNDPRVQEDLDIFLEYLKTGICNLIDIFEPEVVCFGGSFSYYEGNPIYDKLIEKINEPKSTFNDGEKPKFVFAKFKNDAGIIGATLG
ncbi:MAG: ROK family protein [Clostridia bacterium]|nr:ROK family protein [Clostridia bacterium]